MAAEPEPDYDNPVNRLLFLAATVGGIALILWIGLNRGKKK